MEKTPKISVVMPVYNAEKTLRAAADSVLGQTFRDLELLLVDDGCTDGSAALIDALAASDGRVRALHLVKNGGASAARNAGMARARGEYLMFMDADDDMERDLLDRVCALPEADVTVWGVSDDYYDAVGRLYQQTPYCPGDGRYEDREAVRRQLIELEAITLLGYTPNKLYRLRTVRESGAHFEPRLVTEDIFFNLDQCASWETMNTLAYPALHYCHRQTGGSITSRFVPDFFLQNSERVARILALYDGWGMTDARVLGVLGGIYSRYFFSALERSYDPRAGMNAAARRAFYRETFASPLCGRVLSHAAPAGRTARLLCALLKTGCAPLCLFTARAIRFSRAKLPALFARLRQSR